MGQKQSKEKLLYKQVSSGNVERIRALRQEGAGLEWMDKQGKTPLILACTKAELYDVAQTLIELGANVNAYRRAPHAVAFTYRAETPLYHAATRGLENTIKWVVIVPITGSCHPKPYKFKLAMYTSLQDAQPRMVMALRNPNVEEPKSVHPDTSVLIYDETTKRSLKLAPSIREGRQQLKWFCDAFKGIRQPVFLQTVLPSAPPLTDDDTAGVEEGQIHYPLSDSTPDNVPSASVDGENTEDVSSRQCVICMDAPSDAVCVPCGHVAGCMSCLTEIKSKKWGCPVCHAEIDRIMKLYRV